MQKYVGLETPFSTGFRLRVIFVWSGSTNFFQKMENLFQVEIGGQECLAVRISYTGELGWEIYMPRDKMKPVYNTLMEKGKLNT